MRIAYHMYNWNIHAFQQEYCDHYLNILEKILASSLNAYIGGGGTWDFAIPIHATIPTARIIHPNISYFRSLFAFFLEP
jgi:hypothetical protein